MSHDHCIIRQCEHGMQLSLRLLTSKKQVVKAITGHISRIRNFVFIATVASLGGIPMVGNMSLAGSWGYIKRTGNIPTGKNTPVYLPISLIHGELDYYLDIKAQLPEKEQGLGDRWVASDGRCQAGIVCASVLSLESHTRMTATNSFNFCDPTPYPKMGLTKPA